MKRQSFVIMALVILGSIFMAVAETVIEPPYAVKSLLKVIVFFAVPLIVMKLSGEKKISEYFISNGKGFLVSLGMGVSVYAVVMVAFLLTRNIFDYSAVTASLSTDQGVDNKYFLPVAAYICFGNSLLEEFMFRMTAFLRLRDYIPKKWAYLFSSVTFAVYHIAMLAGSFPLPMLLISLFGLAVGGLIFDFFDDKNGDIYSSWLIHMGADIAIMNIWFIMI